MVNIESFPATHDEKNLADNGAAGQGIALNNVFAAIRLSLFNQGTEVTRLHPWYRDFRVGDVRHLQADITKAKHCLAMTRNIVKSRE